MLIFRKLFFFFWHSLGAYYITWSSSYQFVDSSLIREYWFLTPEFPECITFRPRNESIRQKIMGFSAIFYLDDFLPLSIPGLDLSFVNSQSSGVKVFIHPAFSMPYILDSSAVSAGQQATFKIISHVIKHLGGNYGPCSPPRLLHHENAGNFNYTYHTCQAHCRQNRLVELCGCLNGKLPTIPEQREKHNFCGCVHDYNITKTYQKSVCVTRVLDDITDDCNKHCLPPCTDLR